MYSTICCTVTIHSTICKNTTNVKVAIIQLINDNFWRQQQQQNCCSLPASCLNMHNFSTRVFIECPRPEFGNTFQERLLASQKTKCHDFNLTYLVHFNVLFYLRLTQKHSQFCNLCAHKLNGCHLNNRHYWETIFRVVVVQLRRCRRGIWTLIFLIFGSSKNKVC